MGNIVYVFIRYIFVRLVVAPFQKDILKQTEQHHPY